MKPLESYWRKAERHTLRELRISKAKRSTRNRKQERMLRELRGA
jgi:hypothetical protein